MSLSLTDPAGAAPETPSDRTSTTEENTVAAPSVKRFDGPRVLSELVIRDVVIPNRLWVAPMGQHSIERRDGVPVDWQLVHLGQYALGGAGLIFTEAAAISEVGKLNFHGAGIWNDEQARGWARVTSFLHQQHSLAGIQLVHGGRKSATYPSWGRQFDGRHAKSATIEDGGWETVGPSAIAYPGFSTPRELTTAEVEDLPAQYASAAKRAVDAGFDVIEIHAGHGFLLHQFLSPLSNQRTDGYGGSLDNRIRLLEEIIVAVRAGIGSGVPLFVRFSATDWAPGGWDESDTVRAVEKSVEAGADLFDISSGGNVPAVDGISVYPGYQVGLSKAVRDRTGVLTAAVGVIVDGHQAEQILQVGAADAIFVGKQFLRDPYFARHVAEQLKAVDSIFVPPQYEKAYGEERW